MSNLNGDGIGSAGLENEAKVPGSRDEGAFVGRLRLVFEFPRLLFRHHRVAHGQQTKELVTSRIFFADRVQQQVVVELERRLVHGVE